MLNYESWRYVHPAGFDFRLVGADGFRADVLHQRADVLEECGQSGRKALVAHVRWNRAGEGLARGDVELGAVHGASDKRPFERAQF